MSIPFKAENSGSFSHTYSRETPPLLVLVERWHSSWVEAKNSALISRWFGVHRAVLEVLCWTCSSARLGTVYSCNLWSWIKEDKPLVMLDGEWGMALEPMQWNQASSWVLLGYTELFLLLWWPHGLPRLVTMFLGTLWRSIKEVKDPFLFDGENEIALCAIQGNQAWFHCEGEVSWFFSSLGVNLGYIL